MADPFSIIANVLGLLDVTLSVVDQTTIRPYLRLQDRTIALKRYYGLWTALVLNTFARDTWCIQVEILRPQSHNKGLGEEFRRAYLNECNMTAVTVSHPRWVMYSL